jgi:OFA family oxalate/formate antiporter-like MFS transporter
MIISYEKQILTSAFASFAALATIVSIVPSFTAGFNALGRIGYSTLSDKLRQRNTIYKIIFISSAAITFITLASGSILNAKNVLLATILIAFLLIINAGYGGGFSTLPALLSERFGMKEISQIHGLALSAWAVAGLTGNNTSEIILKTTGSYQYVLVVSGLMYVIALIICYLIVRNKTESV